MYIDSHAHITSEFYDDIDSVIEEAQKNGVEIIINCADSIESSREIVEKKQNTHPYYPVIGIHPENAYQIKEFGKLKNLYSLHKDIIKGIGEIGLDYYHNNQNKKLQIECFEKLLLFAEKEKLPVVVHSREATEDTLNIIKKYNVKGIIHCFSGSTEIAKEYIKLGFKIGVGGIVTFKNSKKLKEVVQAIGIDHIVLETDSPFLTPEPYRKYKNEPKYIPVIADKIAELLSISSSITMEKTTQNVKEIFDID